MTVRSRRCGIAEDLAGGTFGQFSKTWLDELAPH